MKNLLKLNQIEIDHIEKIIGYKFKNKQNLLQAFTHTSYANENKTISYERLEFLGDAALQLVVTTELYERFPDLDEGNLTKARAYLVSCKCLSKKMKATSLMDHMLVGEGDIQSHMRSSRNMMCDLFEAIAGGILIDNDFDLKNTRDFILKFLQEDIVKAASKEGFIDYKSLLLERCAQTGKKADFVLANKNKKFKEDFVFELYIDGKKVSLGQAQSKKEAQMFAAQAYFETLK